MKKMKIEYVELPVCEGCGEGHKVFGTQIFDGFTFWCLDCWNADHNLSTEKYERILAEEKKRKQEYFKKKALEN